MGLQFTSAAFGFLMLACAGAAAPDRVHDWTAVIDRAADENSSALLVWENGELVVEEYFGGHRDNAIVSMSISKSLVALAYAHALDQGHFLSWDQPVQEYFEQPHQVLAGITIRHLLNHTSGLDPEAPYWNEDNGSIIESTLASARVSQPGSRFAYNNRAVDLAAAIFVRITGIYLDDYLRIHILEPMEARGYVWSKDSRGQPFGSGGLAIRPIDLISVGRMMLNRGRFASAQLVSRQRIQDLTSPGQNHIPLSGLLWWRIMRDAPIIRAAPLMAYRKAGAPPKALELLESHVGRSFDGEADFFRWFSSQFSAEERAAFGQWSTQHPDLPRFLTRDTDVAVGLLAQGSLGQYLAVLPEHQVVAVRMRAADADESGQAGGNYAEFVADIRYVLQPDR